MDTDSGDETVEPKAKQSVEARMACYNVQPGSVEAGGGVKSEIWEFTAVYASSPDNPNLVWSKATPSANLKMYVSNEGALGKIVSGKQYRVLIEEV